MYLTNTTLTNGSEDAPAANKCMRYSGAWFKFLVYLHTTFGVVGQFTNLKPTTSHAQMLAPIGLKENPLLIKN